MWINTPAKVLAKLIPAMDTGRITGYFSYRLFLGIQLPPGDYRVVYRYKLSGSLYVAQDAFTVLPGGNPDGHVVSMYQYNQPGASWIVQQLESGGNVAGKNPFI